MHGGYRPLACLHLRLLAMSVDASVRLHACLCDICMFSLHDALHGTIIRVMHGICGEGLSVVYGVMHAVD